MALVWLPVWGSSCHFPHYGVPAFRESSRPCGAKPPYVRDRCSAQIRPHLDTYQWSQALPHSGTSGVQVDNSVKLRFSNENSFGR
jgi:hypothetical protein